MSYSDVITATTGLISYYEMDETSGTTCIDSFGTNSGTYSGGFTLNQSSLSALGTAVAFNGSSGIASIPDSASLHLTAPFTLEAWVKTTSSGANTHVFGKHSGSSPFSGYGLNMEFGFAAIWVGDLANGTVRGSRAVNDGSWHHVAVQLLADNTTCKIYVDGVFDLSGTKTPSLSNSAIGMIAGDPPTGGADWGGTVTNIAVYGVALSSGTILAHYEAGIGIHRVSAANTFTLTASSTGSHISVFAVSASSGISVSQFGSSPAAYSVIASSSLSVSHAGSIPVTYSLIASSSFSLSFGATAPRTYIASASTLISVRGFSRTIGPRIVSARSMFYMNTVCSGYVSPIPLSAITSILISQASVRLAVGDKPVSAATAMTVGVTGSPASRVYYVSAASEVDFFGFGSETKYSAFRVSAANRVTFSQVADRSKYSALRVSAGSGIMMSSPALSKMDRVLAAASSFALSTANTRARDIYASAATGLGLTDGPVSNQFYYLTLTTSIICSASATALITGTLASSGILFTDRAFATLEFPWRRAALTRDPGGNIPHS